MARLPRVTILAGVGMTVVGLVGFAAGWGSEPPLRATPRSPTTSGAAETELPAAFLARYVSALQHADTAFLVDRLDQAVIDRYGKDQCATFVAKLADPKASLQMVTASGPANFDYASDGLTRAIPSTYTFAVDGTVQGTTGRRDYHFALVDGRYRTFVDCGTPTRGAP